MSRDKHRARVKNSEGGEVPEKYYVVTNNDMVRVRYVLVYAHGRRSAPAGSELLRSARKHKQLLAMVFYVFLLIAIGLYNSKWFQAFCRRMLR